MVAYQKGQISGMPLRSTEVLDLDSREITAGEPMITPRRGFHLATIRQEGLEKVFAVGGRYGSRYENTVEDNITKK